MPAHACRGVGGAALLAAGHWRRMVRQNNLPAGRRADCVQQPHAPGCCTGALRERAPATVRAVNVRSRGLSWTTGKSRQAAYSSYTSSATRLGETMGSWKDVADSCTARVPVSERGAAVRMHSALLCVLHGHAHEAPGVAAVARCVIQSTPHSRLQLPDAGHITSGGCAKPAHG